MEIMIKVFLVEDEIIMREGIRNNINWEQEGFEFVGEASDGELAYPLILKLRPDILITDIKMPFMDGLELSRLIKQEMPEIKIIILSGYNEFEYAQESINIGITEYLLKPIVAAKLLEAVRKVGQLVLEEREHREVLKTFEQEHMENVQLARQKLFRRLVLEHHAVSDILKEGREIGLDLAADRYNILLFQLFAGEEVDCYSESRNLAAGDIEQLTARLPEVIMIELGVEGWVFILKELNGKSLGDVLDGFLENLQEILADYRELEYFGGIGEPVERLSELGQCFETANHVFAYRYIQGKNQILRSGELPVQIHNDREQQIALLEVRKIDKKIIEHFLKTGLKSEVPDFVDKYFERFGEGNMQSFLFRQYVVMDMYFAAMELLEEIGCDDSDVLKRYGDFQTMAAGIATFERSREYLQSFLESIIELREGVSQKKYHALLLTARNYIREHYDDENISLNSVAASVNLSPNHFSAIFSQETGQTFIEYLTSVRMERARELLRTSSMKTVEIAYAVGYRDPHYFSYLFKKTQDCTPTEFRHQV